MIWKGGFGAKDCEWKGEGFCEIFVHRLGRGVVIGVGVINFLGIIKISYS